MIELRLPRISGVTVPDVVPPAVAPSLERLRRVAASYQLAATKLHDLEAELNAAAAADRDVAAKAMLAGQRAPDPTAPDIEAKLVAARQQLDVVQAACVTGVHELLASINAAAVDWRVELDERRADVVDDVRSSLAALVDSVERLREAESVATWLDGVTSDELRLESSYGGDSMRMSKRLKPGASAIEHNVPAALDALRSWVAASLPASVSSEQRDELASAVTE